MRVPNGWTTAIVALLIGAALTGGAAYYLRLAEAEKAARELADARDDLIAAQARIAALEASAAAAAEVSSATEPPVATETTPKPAPANPAQTRRFGFITTVKPGSKPVLTIDYADFLTGKPAADAAASRGDESPPPNDYYIVNDTRSTTRLTVRPGTRVTLVSNPDGTSDPAGYTVDLATWVGFFEAPSDENAAIREGGYWLTIDNGVVTGISEQFLP